MASPGENYREHFISQYTFLIVDNIHLDSMKRQTGSSAPPSISVEPGKNSSLCSVYNGGTTL